MTIKTAQEIESAFREELQALLKKYGATVKIEERSTRINYSDYREPFLVVSIPAIYQPESYEVEQEYCEFELPRHMSPEE